MKTTQTENVVILTILRVEKCWAKVTTKRYSLLIRSFPHVFEYGHHEATTLHGVTTLQTSLPV